MGKQTVKSLVQKKPPRQGWFLHKNEVLKSSGACFSNPGSFLHSRASFGF